MQLSTIACSIDHCLNWIGKELKIYDHDESDHEWLLNYSDTHVTVSRDCKFVGIGHKRHCFLCLNNPNENEYELIQVNSPCKYEG